MIFRFRLISSEVRDFIRDIEIRSDQSFYDFHFFLTREFHYDNSQLASFYISNPEWEKEVEITLFDVSEGANQAIRIMDRTRLDEYFSQKKQRLLYVFDYFNERLFFIELMDIYEVDSDMGYPRITKASGSPPHQILVNDFNFYDMDPDE